MTRSNQRGLGKSVANRPLSRSAAQTARALHPRGPEHGLEEQGLAGGVALLCGEDGVGRGAVLKGHARHVLGFDLVADEAVEGLGPGPRGA